MNNTADDQHRSDQTSHLGEDERQQIQERMRPSATIVHETIRMEAEEELRRTSSSLAWSGLAAGLAMGFSMLAEGFLHAALPNTSWRPLIAEFGYPVGFLIVVLGRQQLYTENTLTPVLSLLEQRDATTLWKVVRLWSIVLVANLIGTLIFAAVVGQFQVFSPEVHQAFEEIGQKALHDGFGPVFLRAVFAGWLIALMVWLLPGAESSRVAVIVIITYLVGLAGLSHVIAGSVEVFYLAVTGSVSWATYLTDFLAPSLLGNTLGGVVLVAMINHAQADIQRQRGEGTD